MLGILIDVGTLVYRKFFPRKIEYRSIDGLTITAICPAYNEEGTIKEGVEALINQSIPVKNIFILDDCSTDRTEEAGKELQERYPGKVIYLRMKVNSGKAKNINSLIENRYFDLGDLIFINDGDCIPIPDCLEMLMQKFKDKEVVAVTGFPIITESSGWINNMFTKGKNWQIHSLNFRKTAQCERDSMSVLSGAICMYDKSMMKKYPIPIRTVTEDLDHTWVLLEEGKRLEFERYAYTISPDVSNLKSQWAQTYRWNKGFWQTFYFHRLERSFDKSFWLKYSVIYVTFLDLGLMLLRYILTSLFVYTGRLDIMLILLGEMMLYAIPGAVFYGYKGILYLPFNYLYQVLTFVTFIVSGYRMTLEYMQGKLINWGNRWSRDYGKRSVILDSTLGSS
jgi:cellulose synthase/poly-beta-1,6-N-acetylglucosamine synthase-like glycosyltransferase